MKQEGNKISRGDEAWHYMNKRKLPFRDTHLMERNNYPTAELGRVPALLPILAGTSDRPALYYKIDSRIWFISRLTLAAYALEHDCSTSLLNAL
jgi:hypothetical protein